MKIETTLDWDEALEYLPGTIVEIKSNPGLRDIVESYDPMMVPPIWLQNDPCPRYAHELEIVSRPDAPIRFLGNMSNFAKHACFASR